MKGIKAWALSKLASLGLKIASGPASWLVSLLLDKVIALAIDAIKSLYEKAVNYFKKKEVEKKFEKAEEASHDPDDKKHDDAFADLVGSGPSDKSKR